MVGAAFSRTLTGQTTSRFLQYDSFPAIRITDTEYLLANDGCDLGPICFVAPDNFGKQCNDPQLGFVRRHETNRA